jgi:NAD(P)-dependent dehydrogenase (short-subunit alcohol dehydrogenase family)
MLPSIDAFGAQVHAVACDVRRPDDVQRAHRERVAALGAIDILVNNAGLLSNDKIESTTESGWREVMAVNMDGPMLLQIPVGRFCEPEEFAHGVSFLCSPLSAFITGEIIDLDRGLHMD